ncbi:Palmitoyltransferase [Lachnellula arida]|uniref:Palmitoyltransferase n=1 Tax=Lachnellula arida TaxID=1316785 RepID=A0A8T9BSH0_9HELO|nr:Palmitoyltransferase [Lachnellula arida]
MDRIQKTADRNKVVNLWTARFIPLVLAGVVGYATYVLVALLCVNYLLVKHHDKGAAIPILVIYFLLFIPMAASFFRVLYFTIFDPPYVPLGPAAIRDREMKGKAQSEEDGIGAGAYRPGNYRNDVDSPGLELFYSKDVFVCEQNGKPIWCSNCGNWKPDRAHHDSSSGRCIARMDHFCPWVGGPVGENNFNFFVQFTFWTALYCLHLIIVMAIYVHRQLTVRDEKLNHHFAAILGLAGFFFTFTASMTGTSVQLLITNRTSVERLGAKTKITTLAIKRPPLEELARINPYTAQNPSYNVITYPLEPDHAPASQVRQGPPVISSAEMDVYNNTLNQDQESSAGPEELVTSNSPTGEDASMAEPTASGNNQPSRVLGNGISQERMSARDLNATKTFAILNTSKPGDNPWALGSGLANWQTVMGTGVLDWFLPIHKSPCSYHEDPESHFALGPAVDRLREQHSFIAAGAAPSPRGRKELLHRLNGGANEKGTQGKKRNEKVTPTSTLGSIKMKNLNGHASRPPIS